MLRTIELTEELENALESCWEDNCESCPCRMGEGDDCLYGYLRLDEEEQTEMGTSDVTAKDDWTPVSKKLPNITYGLVTVKYEQQLGDPVYMVKEARFFGEHPDDRRFVSDGYDITDFVVAWRPSVEPYKEDENEI